MLNGKENAHMHKMDRLAKRVTSVQRSMHCLEGRVVAQVDTHVHHSACMHQKHLLRFIKSKLRKEPDEVVIFRDGKYLTLKEVFESLSLTGCARLLAIATCNAMQPVYTSRPCN